MSRQLARNFSVNEPLSDDEEEEEEIKISPSGSVLMASENPYNKSQRIREANADLVKVILPKERRPGKVRFEEIINFNSRKQDVSDNEEGEEEPEQHSPLGMEEQITSKLLIVSLLPVNQNSEDLISEDSENEEKYFDDDTSRQFLDTNTCCETTIPSECEEGEGIIEEVFNYVCIQEIEQDQDEVFDNKIQARQIEVMEELSSHLARTISLNDDKDSEDSTVENEVSDEVEDTEAVDEVVTEEEVSDHKKEETENNSEKEFISDSESESQEEQNNQQLQTKDSEENNSIEEEIQGESLSHKNESKSSTLMNYGSRVCETKNLSKLFCPRTDTFEEKYSNYQKNINNHLEKKISKESKRPSTAPTRRFCSPAWKRDQLPQYNGLRSEYGLSAEQLKERKRNKTERKKFIRIRRQQKNMEEEQRRYENNLIFSSWLARKRREANEKLMACNRLAHSLQFKTMPAPTAHLEKTGALRKKELKRGTTCHSLEEFFSQEKMKQQKTYRIYLGVSVE